MPKYAVIDRPGQAPWRQSIIAAQTRETVKDGIHVPAETLILTPNGVGIIDIPEDHPHRKQAENVIKAKMAKVNKPGEPPLIAGPFETAAEAHKAQHELRPKTDSEVAAQAKAIISTKDGEIDRLKAEISRLGKSNPPSKP